MRICIISHEYSGTFAYRLSHGLKETGHEVEVVSLAVDSNKRTVHEGVTVHSVLSSDFAGDLENLKVCMPYSRNALKIASALWSKALQLHKEKAFDVIDVSSILAQGIYPSLTNVAPLTVRLCSVESKLNDNVKPKFDRELTAAFEQMVILSADAIVAPSPEVATSVSEALNIDSTQIRIVLDSADPVEIAKRTVEVYQLAISSFSQRYDSTLYLRPPQEFLTDVQDFAYAFDKAIADFLYFHSWSFRFRHWYKLRQSPKLLAAKIYTKAAALVGLK